MITTPLDPDMKLRSVSSPDDSGQRHETEILAEAPEDIEDFFASVVAPGFPVEERLRLVVYRECDGKERRLLFDSDCVKPRQPRARCSDSPNGSWECLASDPCSSTSQPPTSVTPDGKFELRGCKSDAKAFGELVFGALPMAYKGDTLKLHQLRDPPRLMVSKVFPGPKSGRRPPATISEHGAMNNGESGEDSEGSQYSTINSLNSLPDLLGGHRSAAKSIPSPGGRKNSPSPPGDFPQLFKRSQSVQSSLSPQQLATSLQRRWLIARATSMENGFHGVKRQSNGNASSDDDELGSCGKRTAQIGLAVLVEAAEAEEFRAFLFAHAHLVEKELEKLQQEIRRACLAKTLFFQIIHEAWRRFQRALDALYASPRLATPVWLSLMQENGADARVADSFLDVLIQLSLQLETRAANFFLSTLLTAVLSHHLTWVSSVSGDESTGSFEVDKRTPVDRQWKEVDDSLRPYNPYWAQYTDVTGAVGASPKAVRTLVIGQRKDLIDRLLYVLSYFVRCSEVKEYTERSIWNLLEVEVVATESASLSVGAEAPEAGENEGSRSTSTTSSGSSGSASDGSAGATSTRSCRNSINSKRGSLGGETGVRSRRGVRDGRSEPDFACRSYGACCQDPVGGKKISVDSGYAGTGAQSRAESNIAEWCPACGRGGEDQQHLNQLQLHQQLQQIDLNENSVDSGIDEYEATREADGEPEPERVSQSKPALAPGKGPGKVTEGEAVFHRRCFRRCDEVELGEVEGRRESGDRDGRRSVLRNLGRSLLGAFSEKPVCPHFALAGGRAFHATDEATTVVANVDDFTVTVDGEQTVMPAKAVLAMIDQTRALRQLNCPTDFCLMHVEECLGELYRAGRSLAAVSDSFEGLTDGACLDAERLAMTLGCDASDLPLLSAVAGLDSLSAFHSLIVH